MLNWVLWSILSIICCGLLENKNRAPGPYPSLRSSHCKQELPLITVCDLQSTLVLWVSSHRGGEVPCPWLWHLTHLVSSGYQQGIAKDSWTRWGPLIWSLGLDEPVRREGLPCLLYQALALHISAISLHEDKSPSMMPRNSWITQTWGEGYIDFLKNTFSYFFRSSSSRNNC